jgi:hypothetical protein
MALDHRQQDPLMAAAQSAQKSSEKAISFLRTLRLRCKVSWFVA